MSPATRSLNSEVLSLLTSRTTALNGALRSRSALRPLSSRIITPAAARPTFQPNTLTPLRPFSTSPTLSKKKDKYAKESKKDSKSSSPSGSSSSSAEPDDPFDFSQLQTGISDAVARLKDDISKLRAGGRFNPEAIESLRIPLKKGAKETAKLGELAQVIPKGGRMVTVLVGEEEYLKPISSAITSSNLSLTPQPDAHNSLQLNIPIPPPTKESRDQSVKDAKAAMDKASNAVRNARGALNKKLKNMGVKKVVRPDDLRKAIEQMEKVAEKGQKEVKDVFEGARKTLESS
ncbi:hypothetical protein FQN55_003046 [Onygenales sp. PD_40]|nr:hypothetical protein FQN55_003046 [Onygenales sp. PD_40]KAK2796031.1 hypothetical protein FQN52_000004 [Onygenales sp. PD_12]